MSATRYIAFDAAYSGTTGYAWQATGGGWLFGTVDPMARHAVIDLLRDVQSAGIEAVVIEDCYLGENPNTFGLLSEVRGRISAYADLVGMPWHKVSANTWRSGFKIYGKREPCKAEARRQAGLMTGHEFVVRKKTKTKVDETDMAEAVLLCDYANRVGAYEAMETRAKKGQAK
jgi:hypothetical protein